MRLKNSLNFAKALKAFVLLVRQPEKLDQVIEIAQSLARPELAREIANHASTRSREAAWALETKPRIDLKEPFRLEKALKPDSLGAAFVGYIRANSLNPDDLPNYPANTREEFVMAHLYETHDVWHVVTGFKTDVAGELGLQAFYLAQLPMRFSAIILGGGFLNTVFYAFEDRDRRLEQIVRGWTLGKRAQPLFGFDWNSNWDQPLELVRKKLGLTVDASQAQFMGADILT